VQADYEYNVQVATARGPGDVIKRGNAVRTNQYKRRGHFALVFSIFEKYTPATVENYVM
jgi:hypothetical protein